jgi:lipoprotein
MTFFKSKLFKKICKYTLIIAAIPILGMLAFVIACCWVFMSSLTDSVNENIR